MSKRKFQFAADDRAMASRALAVLDGDRAVVRTQADLPRLLEHVGSDGFLVPLAIFGFSRWCDAQRDEPEVPDSPLARLQAEGRAAEKATLDALVMALPHLERARDEWAKAAEARAGERRAIGPAATGEAGPAVVMSLLPGAYGVVDALPHILREFRRDSAVMGSTGSFPSLCGVSDKERAEELNRQAGYLKDAGVALEDIAFVLGLGAGTVQQQRDRVRKRIASARPTLP